MATATVADWTGKPPPSQTERYMLVLLLGSFAFASSRNTCGSQLSFRRGMSSTRSTHFSFCSDVWGVCVSCHRNRVYMYERSYSKHGDPLIFTTITDMHIYIYIYISLHHKHVLCVRTKTVHKIARGEPKKFSDRKHGKTMRKSL